MQHPSPAETTPPPAEDPLATRTVIRLEEAMVSGQNHCLPELVKIIHTLSSKAKEISVADLAELVDKHVAVMAKVITAASSFGYNPGGVDVNNTRDAIQIIGFDRIRSLVTALMLIRNAAGPEQMREQRLTALLAVSSGLTAQAIAAEDAVLDPELAFVCTSLRMLGRLLLSSYLTEEYQTAMALAGTRPEQEVFREIFGTSPLEIGRLILQRAKFPKRLLDTLQETDPTSSENHPQLNEMARLGDVSTRLCQLAMDRGIGTEEFHERAARICHGLSRRSALEKEQLQEILGNMGDKLSQITNTLGFGNVARDVVSSLRWRSGRSSLQVEESDSASTQSSIKPQTTPRSAETPPKTPSSPAPAPTHQPPTAQLPPPLSDLRPASSRHGPPSHAKTSGASTSATSPTPAPASQSQAKPSDTPPPDAVPAVDSEPLEIKVRHWRDGLMSLTSMLGEPRIDLGAIHSLALDFVRQGFGASEAVLLRLDSDKRHFIPTHGMGTVFRQVRGDKVARTDERSVLGICISRRENVAIHNTSDPKTLPYLPAWCGKQVGWNAFIAIPIHDQTSTFALMLLAWTQPTQITLSPENAKLLRSIIATIAAARRISEA